MEEKEKINLIHWTKHWKSYKKVFTDDNDSPDLSQEQKSVLWLDNQKKERDEWLEWRKKLGFQEKYGS
jgi:hypothetical protein